ncbi:hypothetical protein BBI17_009298 [Phytophthora kernoviae]|uniref:Chitin-binding type-1 domain-containing protein n=2 Tax=Phytophthora kernoviae TaxID=325452 RepID=A0A3R7IHW0_9STRA|nr:hypothetical protein G195_008875 [Phytophthora kernoviae 00238/432]RLN14692.1 hypothetical protein BBI17_009298 [Phytophthora kernoviae]
MKYYFVLLLACMLTPNIVTGHGFIVTPELTWVVNPFYDKNAPASFYQSTEAERTLNPLDVYPNLRFIVDRDAPNTNIAAIAANANKKCGMTSTTGTARSISGSFQFGNFPGSPVVPHVGPCEVWVDDVRTTVSRYCLNDFPSWKIPVDMSKCTRATCVVQFIWVATHNPGYEVFKNCFPAIGGGSGTTAPTASPTSSPTSSPTTPSTSCKTAAAGGPCGSANGGAYCPGTQCCSQYGYCGVGSPWCDVNPNAVYNGEKCIALMLAEDSEEDQDQQVKQAVQAQQDAQISDVNAVILSNGAASLDTIITRHIFDRIFPDIEGSPLTYNGLLEAAQSYTEFGQTPNAAINVLEVAYSLGHIAYTTEDLMYPVERGGSQYNPEKYCQRSSDYGCASGANYYGRDPLYLRWNFNYYECATAIGVDIYTNPDHALQSPTTAWKTAFWTWFHLGIHEMSTLPNAFALSTDKLVGDIERSNSPSVASANAARAAKFKTITKILNAKGVSQLVRSCADDSYELLAAEGNANPIVAKARLMDSETEMHGYLAGWANVAVVWVAMAAFVVVAVIKRTANGPQMYTTFNVENGDYTLLTTFD